MFERLLAPALSLALGAGLALVYAAGPKTGGNVTLTDDLPAGSAGSVGLSGVGVSIDGGVGQVSSGQGQAGTTDVESGFFSKLVFKPQSLSSTTADISSVTFTWADAVVANPQGTEYVIEVSSAQDFSGTLFSSAAYSPTAAPQGLLGNTTYFGRIRALYMEGDESGALFDPLDTHLTLAYPPSSGTIAGVGGRSARLAWEARLNFGGHSGSWSPASSALPLARQSHAAAVFGRRVYVSGGVNGGVASEVFVSSVQADGTLMSWQAATPLPAPRHSHAMAASRNNLYVTGGFDGSARSTAWYAPILADGSVGDWRTTMPLPAPRFRHAMAVQGGRLYVTGGDNGVSAQASVTYADIQPDGSLGAWTTVAGFPLPAARSGHSMVVSSGTLYVAGGVTSGVTATVFRSDLDVNGVPGLWSAATALPLARTQGALVAGDGRLFFIGGHDGAAPVASVYSVPIQGDMSLGAWSAMPDIATARLAHAAARVNDRLFVIGGSDGATALQAVEVAAIAGTEYLSERATDANFTANLADSGWRAGTEFEFDALTPNTTYFFRARARNGAAVESAKLAFGPALTLAALPAPALSTFTSVDVASIGVQWSAGLNPAGTEFRVQASTAADFTAGPISAPWATPTSALFAGLQSNTSYYFRVQARNSNLLQTPALGLGAVYTLSSAPVNSAITSVQSAGFVLEWSTGSLPAWTRYEAQASTAADFSTIAASSVTLSSMTLFAGLPSAATFYARVRSINGNGVPSPFDAVVSTRTTSDVTAPGVSTGTIAYPAGTPGAIYASWIAPGDDGYSGDLAPGSVFYVQWSSRPPAGVTWTPTAAQVVLATGPVSAGSLVSTLVAGLPLESTATLRVWARDESGNFSAPSDTFPAFASPFSIARLDGAALDTGLSPSLAVDRFGNLHLAYRTAAGDIRYLKRTGAAWGAIQAPDPGVIAAEVAVAVDNDGNPQLAYRDAGVARLKLAKFSGTWSAQIVEAGDFRLGGLALDAEGRAVLSYHDVANASLKQASWTGVGWSTGTLSLSGGRVSALALDGAQVPQVLYSDDAAGRLRGLPGGVLEGAVSVASRPAVALDADGTWWLGYVDALSGKLKVGTFTPGVGANLAPIDDASASGGIALDGAGRAFVAYQGGGGKQLKYARFTGVAWTSGTIDADGVVGESASVAIDGSGTLFVAYYDATRGDLRFAEWSGAVASAAGGNAAGRAMAPSGMAGTALAGFPDRIQWTWTDNASGELGFRLYGSQVSTGPFSLIAGTATITSSSGLGGSVIYTETGLTLNTTYFRYAVVVTSGGVSPTRIAAAFPYDAIDASSPTITNNQPGDAYWRRANSGLYNVDFFDAGGSKLSKFQIKASTVPGGAGPDLAAFTDVVNPINAAAYTTDWALPASVFTALWESATNYITIRAVDGNGNATTLVDAFYVLKDTTPVVLVDGQAGDTALRRSSGTLYNVDALDSASGLAAFQYSASTTPLSADGQVIGWTDIATVAQLPAYTTNWPVAFATLPSDVTTYISVRAWDTAGATTAVVDAFYVRKDTSGPLVAITTPTAGFVSALPRIFGTALDPSGVGGTELAVQENPPGGLYWTGAAFSNASAVFLPAAGQTNWQFAPGIGWIDGANYRIVARSTDALGNFSGLYSTATFTFDSSTPTAGVTSPVPDSAISALAALSGTAADAGAGVVFVEARLLRNTDGFWWDWANDSFAAAPVSVSSRATGTNAWSLAPSIALQSNLATQTSYFIAVRAVDAAAPANSGDFFASGATFTFVDVSAPAAITDLAASSTTISGVVDLAWTAPGDDGASGTIRLGEFRVQYSTDAAISFSSGAAQVLVATASIVAGSRRGTPIGGLIAGATYFLRAWTADDAGNWSPLSNGATMQAGPPLLNRIMGHVVKTSSEGITAVLVEAFDNANALVSSTFTISDGSGTFTLDNLSSATYRVQATWIADGIASSVWQDGIAMGSGNVDFVLEVRYTLATLTGTLQSLVAPQGRLGPSAAVFRVSAESRHFTDSKVELYAGGRKALEVGVSPSGRWTISNLLPGKYGVRAYNGMSYTDIVEVELGEGELKEVGFVYNPLPEQSVFAFPNPARSATMIRFETPLAPLEAQVLIFDIAGQLVREITGADMSSPAIGLYHAAWDLRNMRGEPVASGIYLFMVKVKGGAQEQTAKVVKKLAVIK